MTTKTPRKQAAKHPTQGAVPPIDRGAEDAEVVKTEATETETETETEVEAVADAPMPTAENTAFVFKPGVGCSILDIKEIVLMQLLQIMGGPAAAPGALRHQMLNGERFEQLSPEAQRWFKPIATQPSEA